MKLSFFGFVSCFTAAFCSGTAWAQLQLDWFTIAPGGTSTGGTYTLSSTINEPAASATLSGGTYSLAGGFWSPYAESHRVPTPITFDRTNGIATIQLRWPGIAGEQAVIEASTDLIHWQIIATNTANSLGFIVYSDMNAGLYSHRFYRAGSGGFGLPGTLFYVTNTLDSGAGSLRQAITDANANPSIDSIVFRIPGDGSHTIAPLSQLPTITDPVTIDGYTQSGASPNTLVIGNNAVLKIELDGSLAGDNANGLIIAAANCTVRGLVINRFRNTGVGFETAAILLGNAGGNHIEGNFIGTDPTGTIGRTNWGYGIYIRSSSNVIGGSIPGARNLISANSAYGIAIGIAPDNIIQGNYIGTTASGSSPLGNCCVAGVLDNSGGRTVIGGTNAGAGNVISGNRYFGIFLIGAGTNLIQGNHIGTDPTGTISLGNQGNGIAIENSSGNLVGGLDAAARNIISANGDAGVVVQGSAAVRNAVLGNSIFGNAGLGMDLFAPPGVTPNDPGDADDGPNHLQNFPVLTSAVTSGGGTFISTTLNSTPNTTFRLEFFASVAADATGFGEAETFLGAMNATTDGSGNISVIFVPANPVPAGRFITATATSPGGDTSEFSEARAVVAF